MRAAAVAAGVFLAYGLIVGIGPSAAAADTTATTAGELSTAFTTASGSDNTVTLDADLTSGVGPLSVPAGAGIALDLAGHDLVVLGTPATPALSVPAGSTLTLSDSVGGGSITVTGGDGVAGTTDSGGDGTAGEDGGTAIANSGSIVATGVTLTVTGGAGGDGGAGASSSLDGGYGGDAAAAGAGGDAVSNTGTIGVTGTVTVSGGAGGNGGAGGDGGTGFTMSPGPGGDGGAGGASGSGIVNAGSMTLSGVTSISGGVGGDGGRGGDGGASPTFDGGAGGTGGSAGDSGSGISNTGTITIVGATAAVSGGDGGYGGDGGDGGPGIPEGGDGGDGGVGGDGGDGAANTDTMVVLPSMTFAAGAGGYGGAGGGSATAIPGHAGHDGVAGIPVSGTPMSLDNGAAPATPAVLAAYAPSLTDAQAGLPTDWLAYTGYSFDSWLSTGAAAYTAQWTANDNTVTFDTGSGTSSATVTTGDPIIEPTDPTRSGYTFAGWYTAATGGTAWDFATTIAEDITLHAHWTAISTNTVTFDTGVGTGTYTVATGDPVFEPSAHPTRSGYTFAGWYTAATGGTAWDFATVITGDTTLYAHWTAEVSDDSELAATGMEIGPLPWIGAGLLIAGAGILLLDRRRRQAQPAAGILREIRH